MGGAAGVELWLTTLLVFACGVPGGLPKVVPTPGVTACRGIGAAIVCKVGSVKKRDDVASTEYAHTGVALSTKGVWESIRRP